MVWSPPEGRASLPTLISELESYSPFDWNSDGGWDQDSCSLSHRTLLHNTDEKDHTVKRIVILSLLRWLRKIGLICVREWFTECENGVSITWEGQSGSAQYHTVYGNSLAVFIWVRSFCGSTQLHLTLSHEWALGLFRFTSNDRWEACDGCFLCFANVFFIHVQVGLLMHLDSTSWKRGVSTSFAQFTVHSESMMGERLN